MLRECGAMNKKQKSKNNQVKSYTKDMFLSDLKKVCRPIKKTDKRKPSSQKT